MNAGTAILAVALTVMASMAPAYAGNPANPVSRGDPVDPIVELANYTGLSERRVQMILGCRTCFAEYVYTYRRSLDKFKRALGNEPYERLMAGQPIDLEGEREDHIATTATRRDAP